MRDQIVDFVRYWSEKTAIRAGRFIAWLGITPSKFYSWRQRYGCVNEHNGWVPPRFLAPKSGRSKRLSTFIASIRWKATSG